MKYLLDTDIIVNHLRGKRAMNVSFIQEGSSISIITYGELTYGAYKSTRPEINLSKIEEMLTDLGIQIISLDEKIMEIYGKLKAELEKKGNRLDEFDLLIASTALNHNLNLVTGNIKHFERIPSLLLSS